MDVANLTTSELQALSNTVNTELNQRRELEVTRLVTYVRNKAKQLGPDGLSSILLALRPVKNKYSKRKAPTVLYTDPNTGKTFNGLGRPPFWFLEYRKSGGNIDDICVKL